MKKYMHGEFSTEKLQKVESALNRYYKRVRLNKLVVFIITCFYCLIQGIGYSLSMRYVGDFQEAISFDRIFLLSDIQSFLDKFIIKGYGILNLLFPILVMIGASIVSYITTSLVSVVLNLIKNLFSVALPVRRISDKNSAEKIKKLIKRIKKIRKIGTPEVPTAVVAVFSYLIAAAYPIYLGLEYFGEITPDSLLRLALLTGMILVVMTIFGTIPLSLSFFGVTVINSSFYNRISDKLYPIEKVLDNWWVETDPEEKRKRERDAEERRQKRYNDSYIATMAKVYAREQRESSSSSYSDHGPYATATNCGMPDIFGMPPGLDVSDM